MKPDIIYITGAPGSGKSTLAAQLNAAMYSYTHIDPDDLLQSFWETNQDPDYDRETIGIPRLHKILHSLLENKVRLIYDGKANNELMIELNGKYTLLNIHCVSDNSAQRFLARETNPDGTTPEWVDEIMPSVRQDEVSSRDPVDVGQRKIIVNCTSDYEPTISELLKQLGF